MSGTVSDLLAGQAAIVTGAAQGIGLAIAARIVASGGSVLMADLDEAKTQAAAASLGAGRQAVGIRCDVTQAADHDAAVAACLAAFGRVDILVNNAGVTRDGYISRLDENAFDMVVGVSLKGAWLGTRAVAARFREQKSGAIVNLSSISGRAGSAGQTNYSAAKAGIVGLTKAAAKELGPSGVRVNAVMPGLIRTAMTLAMKPEIYEGIESSVPLGRSGTPDEVAAAVLFLASPWASYVTGAVLEVTGGL